MSGCCMDSARVPSHRQRIYRCAHCAIEFASIDEMAAHYKSEHAGWLIPNVGGVVLPGESRSRRRRLDMAKVKRCRFCGRECKPTGIGAHESRCPKNPTASRRRPRRMGTGRRKSQAVAKDIRVSPDGSFESLLAVARVLKPLTPSVRKRVIDAVHLFVWWPRT